MTPNIFASDGEDVEGHEPQPGGRGRPAGKHRAGDRGEVLLRPALTLRDYDQLTVKHRSGRDLGKRGEQGPETSGEIGAVA
jgi:hypothetical protein